MQAAYGRQWQSGLCCMLSRPCSWTAAVVQAFPACKQGQSGCKCGGCRLALHYLAFILRGSARPRLLRQVPIAVQGRIVNWIDSKATFGDDKLHRCEPRVGPGQKVGQKVGRR